MSMLPEEDPRRNFNNKGKMFGALQKSAADMDLDNLDPEDTHEQEDS